MCYDSLKKRLILSVALQTWMPARFWLLLFMWSLSKIPDFTSHAEHTSATVWSLTRKSRHLRTPPPHTHAHTPASTMGFICLLGRWKTNTRETASIPCSALQKISFLISHFVQSWFMKAICHSIKMSLWMMCFCMNHTDVITGMKTLIFISFLFFDKND